MSDGESAIEALLTEKLEAQLPGVDVLPAGETITGLERDTVLVAFADVVPVPEVPRGREYEGALLAVSPIQTGTGAAIREDVLDALDKIRGVRWTRATRATLDETWPAWEITVRFPILFHDL